MESEFANKVAIISGSFQGIGKAVANMLLENGAKVVGLDIQYQNSSLKTPGSEGIFEVETDVSNSKSVHRVISEIEEILGPIEYLASVAGILRMGNLLELTDNDWNNTFAVNVTGPFNLFRAVGIHMAKRNRGSMVAIGSNAAGIPRIGMGSYAASKAALTNLVKCFGLELASHNIRCNVVAPGSTDTEMQRQLWQDASGPEKVIAGNLEQFRLGIPLKRIADPSQIANLVMFLLSNKASHITMENILVDGGATLGC